MPNHWKRAAHADISGLLLILISEPLAALRRNRFIEVAKPQEQHRIHGRAGETYEAADEMRTLASAAEWDRAVCIGFGLALTFRQVNRSEMRDASPPPAQLRGV